MTLPLSEDAGLLALVNQILGPALHEAAVDVPPLPANVARAILDSLEAAGLVRQPVLSDPSTWQLPPGPDYSAPAVAERPVLRVSWCAMCLQEAANRTSAGMEPLTVHPAVTVIAGNAICNVEGRHRIVAAQAAALHQPGHIPPGNPFRRAG